MYSTGQKPPAIDAVNTYATTFEVLPDNSIHFTSYRALDPNVNTETYVIQLDTPINMILAYKADTYVLGYHGTSRYQWTMTLNSDGGSSGGGASGGGISF